MLHFLLSVFSGFLCRPLLDLCHLGLRHSDQWESFQFLDPHGREDIPLRAWIPKRLVCNLISLEYIYFYLWATPGDAQWLLLTSFWGNHVMPGIKSGLMHAKHMLHPFESFSLVPHSLNIIIKCSLYLNICCMTLEIFHLYNPVICNIFLPCQRNSTSTALALACSRP